MTFSNKQIFTLASLFLSFAAYAESLPKNILEQLPKGYEVMTFLRGQLNDDKLTDYLVVVRKRNEEAIYEKTQEASPRPLYLFIQNKNASFNLLRKNENVVFTIDQGGQCDPFMDGEDGLAIKKHYFTVQNGVSCGSHWNDFITFKYEPSIKNWVFHKRVQESWHLNNSNNANADALVEDKPNIVKADTHHPILFEKYKID